MNSSSYPLKATADDKENPPQMLLALKLAFLFSKLWSSNKEATTPTHQSTFWSYEGHLTRSCPKTGGGLPNTGGGRTEGTNPGWNSDSWRCPSYDQQVDWWFGLNSLPASIEWSAWLIHQVSCSFLSWDTQCWLALPTNCQDQLVGDSLWKIPDEGIAVD